VAVVLNPAPARSLPSQLLAWVDILIPNENELALLTGIQVVSLGLDSMVDMVSGAVIVTLGGNGVMVAERRKRHHLPAYPVEVIDTVAAGDAFVGAFAVALAEGKFVVDAAGFGNAAGALTVTHPGAQPSIPTRAELDKFLGISHDVSRAL
jgi:ribokinase